MDYQIKRLVEGDAYFPQKLYQLDKKVKELFVIGDETILNNFSLGIVGSRKCSEYGRMFAERLSEELSLNNINIVSGLAIGIDSAAHTGCLNVNGKTVAVLGSGFNQLYPKCNRKLVDEILKKGGAVISEYYVDMPPLPKNFLERNRIIAGLSDGVVLCEAKAQSGSLTTARYALELNRKLFAIPGSLDDEYYIGNNKALSDGAICIRNSEDVLKHYESFNKPQKKIKETKKLKNVVYVPKDLEKVYSKIKKRPTSFEEISSGLEENVAEILMKLIILEIDGYIKKLKGEKFIKLY